MGSHSGSLSTAEREAPPQQTKWLTLMLLRRSVTSTTGMARASSTSSFSATSCTPWATTPPRRCASASARPTRRARSSPSSTTSSPRSRRVCSPTCPSSTGSPARPKNPTKLQSQASKRPWQHGTLLKKILQLPSPLGVTKQHQKQPKLQYLQLHLQTLLHKQHQEKRGAWRIYIKPKHFCLS